MSKNFNNKLFEEHISDLIIDKENLRYLEKQKMIMKKIVYILAEENWVDEGYSESQVKFCREFLEDYAWVYAVNELITIQNDNGTFKVMPGVKKWSDNYEENFLNAYLKTKELKANKKNIVESDNLRFKNSFYKISKAKNQEDLVKKTIAVGEKYGISKNDLISERGYNLDLEGRILDNIWNDI
ncbi:MAG: hypothetical protein CMG74_03455 [Candidatus Marinimicrobia bacterium]|nr:hypothetical protein [Candidatus Neomarinimicrobiota bacterium]|tara:strand:- start:15774 stop:16325 length:552 start_codon:yes stop_codon:yes gene_type:complete